MVQYVLTPWWDRNELLLVRDQFYAASSDISSRPSPARRYASHPEGSEVSNKDHHARSQPSQSADGDGDTTDQQRQAVARVSMWMQRGNCPHLVEATALLTAAVLSDHLGSADAGGSYAVRAAYSAAFSRFVTGLLDGHQDKQRKQSMYSIAKTIGLPATFVELRHQATHEQLPSLAKLRAAARKALAWIWDYYWKDLADENRGSKHDACREAVLEYLRGEGDDAQREKTMRRLGGFEKDRVLAVIAVLQAELPGNQVYLRCLKLSKEIMMRAEEEENEDEEKDDDDDDDDDRGKGEAESLDGAAAESSCGWWLYEGEWKAKPIGMV
ncbi:Pre-rRNA-processing protein las1 [Metarhizium anisopliae]|nr:Pre-rRNA-processing protein las1 [Metarhizium anisopliae]